LLVGETAILVGIAREVNCSVRGCQGGENAQNGNFPHIRHDRGWRMPLEGIATRRPAPPGWLVSAR